MSLNQSSVDCIYFEKSFDCVPYQSPAVKTKILWDLRQSFEMDPSFVVGRTIGTKVNLGFSDLYLVGSSVP